MPYKLSSDMSVVSVFDTGNSASISKAKKLLGIGSRSERSHLACFGISRISRWARMGSLNVATSQSR